MIALPMGMLGLPIAIYLAPLYSGHYGISLGIVGGALIGTRLLDVVTDPLVGIISDKWRPAIGRRRVWLIIGTLTLMAGVFLLFRPVENPNAVYFVFAVSLAYFGLTTLRLPYIAWAGELSFDYDTRTRITSTMQFFTTVGLLASTLIPAAMAWQAESEVSSLEVMRAISLVFLILLPITSAIVFFTVPEPEVPPVQTKFNMLGSVKLLASNRPFVILSVVILISNLGEAFRQSTTVFFARDVVGHENIGQVYFFYFVVGLIMIPFWAWLGKRIEKHRAYAAALFILAVTNAAMVALSYGQTLQFMLLFILKGTCFGGIILLPYAMIADTVDIDTAESQDRQQGLFYSVEAMIQKLGFALGAGSPLIILGWIGYNADGESSQGPLQALSLIYSMVPAVLALIASLLIWNYSLTAARHKELRKIIDEKARAQAE
ncbi:MAG: MFS transporter [Pseudomonadota bacterium]